jgi:hypothetical protein
MALAQAPPPYELEHHRAMLSYLQQHRQAGGVIYVVQLQEVGTRFYGPQYGLQPSGWITSSVFLLQRSQIWLRVFELPVPKNTLDPPLPSTPSWQRNRFPKLLLYLLYFLYFFHLPLFQLQYS